MLYVEGQLQLATPLQREGIHQVWSNTKRDACRPYCYGWVPDVFALACDVDDVYLYVNMHT